MPQPKKAINPVKIVKAVKNAVRSTANATARATTKAKTPAQKMIKEQNKKGLITRQEMKQDIKETKVKDKIAKKAASKELKNSGKAGGRGIEKVVLGPKAREKMAKGNFGNKVKQGPAANPNKTSTGTVRVVDAKKRDPFQDRTWDVVDARKAAQSRRAATRSSK